MQRVTLNHIVEDVQFQSILYSVRRIKDPLIFFVVEIAAGIQSFSQILLNERVINLIV